MASQLPIFEDSTSQGTPNYNTAPHGTSLHLTLANNARVHEKYFKDVVESIENAINRSRITEKKYAKVEILCLR